MSLTREILRATQHNNCYQFIALENNYLNLLLRGESCELALHPVERLIGLSYLEILIQDEIKKTDKSGDLGGNAKFALG